MLTPQLLERLGIGIDVAGQFLVAPWDTPSGHGGIRVRDVLRRFTAACLLGNYMGRSIFIGLMTGSDTARNSEEREGGSRWVYRPQAVPLPLVGQSDLGERFTCARWAAFHAAQRSPETLCGIRTPRKRLRAAFSEHSNIGSVVDEG